ncbi:MAG TPA: lytic transglycosylase domain-containing protein [Thermodesulfobacteriota bacterium]
MTTRSGRTTARRLLAAAGAGSLAVLAGVALAERSALEAGSYTVPVPALASVGADALLMPGRSGTPGLRRVAQGPDHAVQSPDLEPRSARAPRQAVHAPDYAAPDAEPPPSRRAAARAERAAMIARLARTLDGFATGLEPHTERRVAAAIYDESMRWGIDPLLTLAVIETESTYRNGAISFVGARGLMQIRPFVGEELAARLRLRWDGHRTLHDPVANVTMGVYYLARLRARFGDLATALAAYNIGPNAVQALIDEEREVPTGYVRKVLGSYARLLADTPARPRLAARTGSTARR